uniref:Reverse transcriptase/retrotransposon-derived protein RNase H-like domain-containing protein n=1 Tax=Amphimedon queenslandica TaxID=400682 RepID=A0A1X7VST7_AMPQE
MRSLEQIRTAGVTLNKDKCEFGKDKISFLGHTINKEGIHADPEKTEAISRMEPLTSITELRRFMGMVDQLGKFSMKLSDLTHSLRILLSTKNSWSWGEAQEQGFVAVKEELFKPTSVAHYNPKAETKVSADASMLGLGVVLLQKHDEVWKPVAFASRSLSDAMTRYAQIEKEALASTWACKKFSKYILGLKFTIETDHKPLVALLGYTELDQLPPRVLRFCLCLTRFDYSIIHVPGKLLCTADTLS